MPEARLCVVGLGNPGPKYQGTRHNIGFDWIDAVVESKDFSSSKPKFQEKFSSLWCKADYNGIEVHFLKPLTFMNNSGQAVREWLDKYQGESRLLIVFDDLDVQLGRLRLRPSGSDGGHRGMRSVIEHVGHQDIARLRIGIGRPAGESIDYVLSSFTPDEKKILKQMLSEAALHLEAWANENTEVAMNKVNGKNYGSGS